MKGPFTPRHLRKRHNNKGGTKDKSKQQAFARAAQWSKRFIHQSASMLASPAMAGQYAEWEEAARRGALRRSTGNAK